MLRILGSQRKLCNGVSRRDLLRAGGWGLASMASGSLLSGKGAAAAESAAGRPAHFGRAKAVILMHLYGATSQLEWADPKPEAPVEIRGELESISSSLPGCGVCELLPNMAKVMDRMTVLRSMTHPYPLHGVANAWTGVPAIDVAMELNPRDPRHWPYFGSVVDFLDQQADKSGKPPRVPRNMALPFRFSSQRVGEVARAGPYAAFLGAEYDPTWTSFVGEATRGHTKKLRDIVFDDNDPYMGVSSDCYFEVPSATSLPEDITLDRLHRRRSLLSQLDDARRSLADSPAGRQLSRHQEMAFGLLESDHLRTALDLRREDPTVRELYGDMLFGQACLAARRLVEAGSRVVSVFWDEYGVAGTGWDTHWNHYARMRNELCPGLDMALYGLITDLDRRGMLDDTLVICSTEHGRTPKLNKAAGGGRDHWSRVYTTLVAGAGIARGHVVGASDKQGGDVARRPITPKDLQTTMYHLLGIDHHQQIHDTLGRPFQLVEGNVVTEALA